MLICAPQTRPSAFVEPLIKLVARTISEHKYKHTGGKPVVISSKSSIDEDRSSLISSLKAGDVTVIERDFYYHSD